VVPDKPQKVEKFAKTPEPAVKPEIVETNTEATPKKTSWSSQSPQKPESTSSPKTQVFGSTSPLLLWGH